MDNMGQIIHQENIEKRFNRKLIDKKIREDILHPESGNPEKIAQAVTLIKEWLSGTYYASKNRRLQQLSLMDIEKLVLDLFIGIAYVLAPELFTSVTAQLAGRLGFDDKRDSIVTVAELIAVICPTDAFDITKEDRMSSLTMVSRIALQEDTVTFIEQSAYLPPMVCQPLQLKSNYDSGYLSHKDSLILGSGNHHDGNICLDVLNTVNCVKLKLDTEFLCAVEEDPNTEYTVEWAIENAAKKGKDITEARAKEVVNAAHTQWHQFRKLSTRLYLLMVETGNEFYLTNKVDKRGRLYAQGYHITTQGTSFKKAMVELSNEEIVEGVPT